MNNIIMMEPKRTYKLGTRRIDKFGQAWRYYKLDGGITGKNLTTGKVYHRIQYCWIPEHCS